MEPPTGLEPAFPSTVSSFGGKPDTGAKIVVAGLSSDRNRIPYRHRGENTLTIRIVDTVPFEDIPTATLGSPDRIRADI